jgi:hypothetical protein
MEGRSDMVDLRENVPSKDQFQIYGRKLYRERGQTATFGFPAVKDIYPVFVFWLARVP